MSVWPRIHGCRYPRWLSLCSWKGRDPGAVYSMYANIPESRAIALPDRLNWRSNTGEPS